MKTKPTHTPTPWARNIKANGKYPVIFAGRNQHVCTVSQQQTGEETEANIDFIVRAVNSHEALLEALRYMHKEYIDTHKVGHPPKIGCHECEVITQAEKQP